MSTVSLTLDEIFELAKKTLLAMVVMMKQHQFYQI